MVYLRKILVTTDLSQHSLAAMEYAESFGLLYTSRISLLYVVESGAHGFGRHGRENHARGIHPRSEEEARRELAEFVARNINPDIKLNLVIRSGSPPYEIRRFAEEEGIDLIVIATHGWTGLRHIVMGSVAEKILRHSIVPVLSVKPHPMRESILESKDVEDELHLR